jgi:release factor glutamine methyltransferase
MKVLQKINEITHVLEKSDIEPAREEAERLIRHGLDISTVEMYRDNPGISEVQMKSVEDMVEKRLNREPLQYIMVLIPRPETELMAEKAIEAVKREVYPPLAGVTPFRILDVCTGSGCLALALAREFPGSRIYGTDISGSAVDYANVNAGINNIRNAIFLKGSLFKPVERIMARNSSPLTFDLIISNPPYIRSGDIQSLQPEIKDWEPFVALDGGVDGLDFYRKLIPSARHFLVKGGMIMLEVGAGQATVVADMMKGFGYNRIEIIRDLSGIERIIQAQWKR